MIKCVKENCDYFKEYHECSSVCIERGIKKIVTNYDRIKAMSVDEMANFLMDFVTEALTNPRCLVVKNWLESEVEIE